MLNFFRSEEHAREWWERTGAGGGALTLAEAFRLGAAIFGERLPRLLR
jgi:alkylmercury lyase-like protein